MGLDLLLEVGHLLLGEGDSVRAGDEPTRRLLILRDPNERLRELGRIARLLAVLGLPPLELLSGALGVVLQLNRSTQPLH